MPQENAFLGRGWSFPPSFSKQDKSVKMLDAEADIESCISIVLSTELGERVMQPSFGWKRDRWIFESLGTTTATAIQSEIETALIVYEPRIQLNKVVLQQDPAEAGKVIIIVDYTIRSTNARHNLVYPFYLTEK
ncbi:MULTISPECIES: GPW/gp25 family protein [Chitinophaga]|jgi:phage baseplate assembly protein W|uniref:GPW/gp25 family protein n=1 Tax=Chitinophaga caseinilytica TaxID=2267521 RepID=A0ABZ2Z2V2_9BACT|nr:GPW/gp25 family protein [Chitinophaga rhizosphaerae]